jgi:Carboxypeptidase regulatory-like domain
MEKLFEIATKVSGPWSLAAFGIAAIVYIVLKKRGKVSILGWICVLFFVLVPVISAAYVEVARIKSNDASLYRVRVTVLDLMQTPVEDAKVWSTIGGEPKKVSGGWEFDIPAIVKPVDKEVKIFAAVPGQFLSAESSVRLGIDYNPTTILQLRKNSRASIHGVVMDASGRSLEGAAVTTAGSTSSVKTRPDGQFTMATDSSDGEEVLLRVEKDGYRPVQQLHPAGNEPVTILLYPEHK